MKKLVIISGGSSGIGLSCVKKFLNNAYSVINLDISMNTDFSDNESYQYIECDLRKHISILQAFKVMNDSNMLRMLDTLVVSAGKHLSANIENTTDEELNDILDLNMKSAFWLIQLVIPFMKQAMNGNIITIGSDQCSVAKYNSSAYGMSKAALLSLTKSIALDYAKYNIRANCIGVGTIDTPLYRAAIEKHAARSGISLSQIEKEEALELPIGRVGNPEEVAELVYFLSQKHASFITGALLPMDGGYIAR